MVTRREFLIALGASAFAAPFSPFAQQPVKVWRLGYLDATSRQSMMDAGRFKALTDGLRENGFVEGNNLVIEARYADGSVNRLQGLADELVRQKVDLILTAGTPASQAAQKATAAIPIVVLTTTDPVGDGLAASLARPGGNVTGMSGGGAETVQKLVELLAVAVPKINRISVLTNPANDSHPPMLSHVRAAARQIGKQIYPINIRIEGEIELGFVTMAQQGADALVILIDPLTLQYRAKIAMLALKYKLPSIFPFSLYPEAGGLMSYGTEINDNFRRAGIFVDKILKGAKPATIPFEQPTRYYLVINRKTASALGTKLTGEILARADKVIE